MRPQYHPAVRLDVAEAMRRYKAVSQKLAYDFKAELRGVIALRSPILVGSTQSSQASIGPI